MAKRRQTAGINVIIKVQAAAARVTQETGVTATGRWIRGTFRCTRKRSDEEEERGRGARRMKGWDEEGRANWEPV